MASAALVTLSSLLVTITKAWTSPVLIKSSRSFTLSKLEAIKAERPDLLKEFDLTGGRPGAIVETEEELARKEEIQRELDDRGYPDWLEEYGESLEEVGAEYDIDDPEAIDSSTLGTWDIHDLNSEFDYEWKPESGKPDPNLIDVTKEDYIPANPVDEDGIEVGWTAMFGASNPIDTRTIVGTKDSFMVDEETKDDSLLTPLFDDDDAEISYNEDIRTFRKSLDIIETYVDPFLPENMQVPRHVAKWHGYPMPNAYPQKNYTNNRFTKEEDVTPFDDYDPHKARKLAVQYARAKNCEWLPVGVSEKNYWVLLMAQYSGSIIMAWWKINLEWLHGRKLWFAIVEPNVPAWCLKLDFVDEILHTMVVIIGMDRTSRESIVWHKVQYIAVVAKSGAFISL